MILLEAVRAALPADLLAKLAAGRAAKSAQGSGGTGAARKGNRRGRPLPSMPGKLGAGARIDLVDRLSKLDRVAPQERDRILSLTSQIKKQSGLRNRYNHCIYAFDTAGCNPRSILMRIADRKDRLMIGQVNDLDAAAAQDVQEAINELAAINRHIWQTVSDFGYPE